MYKNSASREVEALLAKFPLSIHSGQKSSKGEIYAINYNKQIIETLILIISQI